MNISIAANVLGTIGAVCWSVQLIPQIIINYRRHDTTGLQPSMMLLWASAGVPLGVYNITEEFNIALRIQAQILILLSLVTWAQCGHYGQKWSIFKCSLFLGVLMLTMGGIEAALIISLEQAKSHHHTWPSVLMAILAAVLLAAGVLRHYWDIYIHRTVRGISFIFVGIDAAGDLFSLLSIFFQAKLDVLGIVVYGTELALWIGIFVCGGYFNFLPWYRRRMSRDRSATRSTTQSLGTELDPSDSRPAENVSLPTNSSSTSVFRTPSSLLAMQRNSIVFEP